MGIDLAGVEIGLEIELRPMSGGGVKGGGSQRDPVRSTAVRSTASVAAAGGVAGATGEISLSSHRVQPALIEHVGDLLSLVGVAEDLLPHLVHGDNTEWG